MTTDPYDLIAVLVGALETAEAELEQIREHAVPYPDEIEAKLLEHARLAATFKSAPTSRYLDQLRNLYLSKCKEITYVETPDQHYPVLPEVVTELDGAFEVLRRARLNDPDLDEVLRYHSRR